MNTFFSCSRTIDELNTEFLNSANPEKAIQQAKYMRNKFLFYGMTHPELRKMVGMHSKAGYLPPKELMSEFSKISFKQPQREYHHYCLVLTERYLAEFDHDYIKTLELLVTQKSWWDSVDYLSKLIGLHFIKYPELILVYNSKWIHSDNIWINRVAIIFQLLYKEKTDFELLKSNILIHKDSTEFFIQKASGWALRNYARIDPKAVIHFVNNHRLSKLTTREALRRVKTQ